MKIHQGIKNFQCSKPVTLTSGTFDGVHLGHRKMLHNLITEAKEADHESVLLTFYPHPRMVLHPHDHGLKLLTSPEEKFEILETMGLDHVIVQPFDEEFSSISAYNYVRDVLVNQLGVKKIISGYDHRFGKNREGNFDTLVELGQLFNFEVLQISAKEMEEVKISSTKIRNALFDGDVEMAERYLGRNYQLRGRVIEGKKLGSKLGFPTANLQLIYPHKLVPKNGVYAVYATIKGEKIHGMLNIGTRPTVIEDGEVSIEVHLIGWKDDVYDEVVDIQFIKRLRDEKRFEGKSQLIEQLNIDLQNTLAVLN